MLSVKVLVVFLMFWALFDITRFVNVAEPTAGPWPGSGSSLTQMPKPDLASNSSPDLRAPVIVMFSNVVFWNEFSGLDPLYFVWNMIPEYVGSMMSTFRTSIAVKLFDALNSHIAGKVCWPQKWPPARTRVIPSNVVFPGPKPSMG